MKKIKIGFSKSRAKFPVVAWLIMAAEKTDFSHTYLRFTSESLDTDLIYHAVGSGVNFMGPGPFAAHHEVKAEFELKISDSEYRNLLKWCVENCGKPYGSLQIVGIGLKRLAALLGITIKNPFPNGDYAYVCTEAVFRALGRTGEKLPEVELDSVGLACLENIVRDICAKSEGSYDSI